jgi:hypothetical protein
MANEGTHPYTNIPGIGGLADTSGDSISDQFREGMAFGGPVPGLLNVGIGGLQNLFGGGGGGGDDQTETPQGIHKMLAVFDEASGAGMIDPTLRDQYAAYYNMLLTTGGENSPENREAAAQAVMAKITEDAMMGMQQTQQPAQVTPQDILAQQAQVAAIVQPYTDAMAGNAAARNQLSRNMLGDLPESFQGVMGASLAGQGLAQNQMINALGAQAAMVPQTLAFEQMMQQDQAIAQQIRQQAIQGVINPPQTAAPGLDLNALLGAQAAG